MANIADCSVALDYHMSDAKIKKIAKFIDQYDYQGCGAYITRHNHCVTIDFCGRWCFPEDVENYLNNLGVNWQGASVEDGCDYYTDELGNCDYGLRVAEYGEDEEDGMAGCHYVDLCESEVRRWKVVRDIQGGGFGMDREYTAVEWLGQAMDWLDSDGFFRSDKERKDWYDHMKKLSDEELIDYISETWQIEMEQLKDWKERPECRITYNEEVEKAKAKGEN